MADLFVLSKQKKLLTCSHTLGKSSAISVTATCILSEQGIKLWGGDKMS